jgi:hypothetical protein
MKVAATAPGQTEARCFCLFQSGLLTLPPFQARMPAALPLKSLAFAGLALWLAAAAPAAGETATVLVAEQARGTALRESDAAALSALLSEELRYVHSNGRIESKHDAVDAVREGRVTYERFETSDVHAAKISAEVVVLSGKIDQRKVTDGRGADLRLLFHAVWRNEAGAWRLVSLQTALPPPAKP